MGRCLDTAGESSASASYWLARANELAPRNELFLRAMQMRAINAIETRELRHSPAVVRGTAQATGRPDTMGAVGLPRCVQAIGDGATLPVSLIVASTASSEPLPEYAESVRLDQLVFQCLDMTPSEAEALARAFGEKSRAPLRTPI